MQPYLAETLDSIIKQTIGFESNIQIILVDDGSTDGSGDICQTYVNDYPENIVYIRQENAGVSTARNTGLSKALGRYVHFLDPDDVISLGAYSRALSLFDKHNEKIDLAALRVEFFDGRLGEHPLNHKFKRGTRIIDLDTEPDAVVLHVSSCMIRRESIKAIFDTGIKISEDMKFLVELVMRKRSYGVIADATYYYRKRRISSSAIDTSKNDKSYYDVTPKKVYEYLLNKYDKVKGEHGSHPYVQYAIAYDLQWRLRQTDQHALTQAEERSYVGTIKNVARRIDDEVLFHQREFTVSQLLYLSRTKYGSKLPDGVQAELEKRARVSKPAVIVELVSILPGRRMRIEGRIPNASALHDITVSTKSGFKQELRYADVPLYRNKFLSDTISEGYVFSVDVPVDGAGDSVVFTNHGNKLTLVMGQRSRIPHVRFGYKKLYDTLVLNMKEALTVSKYTLARHAFFELRWLVRILVAVEAMQSLRGIVMMKRSTYKRSIRMIDVFGLIRSPLRRLARNVVVISYRLLYRFVRPRRPVWIFSDRPFCVGDSAEVMYRYVRGVSDQPVDARFIVPEDGDRGHFGNLASGLMSEHGMRYRLLFLRSSKIITTRLDDLATNPFGDKSEFLCDLFGYDHVFMQSGIVQDKLSIQQHLFSKNVQLFVTPTDQDKPSFLNGGLAYPEQQIMCGLPRFDLLENKPKKKIIFAHESDCDLTSTGASLNDQPQGSVIDSGDSRSLLRDAINDKRLSEVMRKHGYTGELHLQASSDILPEDFSSVQQIKIINTPYDHLRTSSEGNVLVTDCSCAILDFDYLKKPVVFMQPGRSEQYSASSVDDRTGRRILLTKSADAIVKEIVELIENDSTTEKAHSSRMHEQAKCNNSKRVYAAVAELEKQ